MANGPSFLISRISPASCDYFLTFLLDGFWIRFPPRALYACPSGSGSPMLVLGQLLSRSEPMPFAMRLLVSQPI